MYQGEDINKFYIEGSDLLGGKYGIAANGISHEDVGAVEVMENHQPMQVLSGISFSDKAAINLKLKKEGKGDMDFPRRCRGRLLMAARRCCLGRRIYGYGCNAWISEYNNFPYQ